MLQLKTEPMDEVLPSVPLENKKQGIIWMLLWALGITLAMAFAKGLDKGVSDFVLVFFRCSFGFLITIPFIFSKGFKTLRTKRLPLHLLRAFFNVSGLGCTYYAYRNLPLAEATAVGFVEPLITIILAAIVLKDKLSLSKWIGVIAGYIGVIIIINPQHIVINHAFYILMLANALVSSYLVCTKILSTTESTVSILTYTNIVCLLVACFFGIPHWQTPDLYNTLMLVGVGVCGIFSQLAYIKALKVADPSFLSPFEYTRLLIAIPIGITFFSEDPSLRVFLGSGIIVLATYALIKIDRSYSS